MLTKLDETGRICLPKVIREEVFGQVEHLLFTGKIWHFQVGLVDEKSAIEKNAETAAKFALNL